MNNTAASVFLTVGSQKQKMLCEKLLATVCKKTGIEITVISDDDFGCRLGSGGAVLNIINKAFNTNKKILIINSGGISKRSVNYAVRGKAFANAEHNGKTVTLLELIAKNAAEMLETVSQGVLICCSDILVKSEGIDFSHGISAGVCIRTNFETASRHGVMLCNEDGKVTDYLHKRSADELVKAHSTAEKSGALVDTGVTFLSYEVAQKLYELTCNPDFSKMLFSRRFEVGLYSDIIALMAENVKKEEYLNTETENEEHRRIKEILFDALSSYPMYAVEAKDKSFMHFGSMAESLENIFRLSSAEKEFLQFNSYVKNTVTGFKTLLDNAKLTNCKIGDGSIISDITLENAVVDSGKTVCGFKLSDGKYVAVVCDVTENPKDKIGGVSLWDYNRFYKGTSFNDSYEKFISVADEERVSLDYCVKNADYGYYFSRQQYLADMNGYSVSPEYIAERNRVIDFYFSNHRPIDVFECKKDFASRSLPLRVNLSGTWTDAMPYCLHNGGQVVNFAIKVDGKLPITVTAEKLESGKIEFCSDDIKTEFVFADKPDEDLSDFKLHKAVLKTLGINSETVLKDGFRLSVKVSDIDKGSGLGISSILLGGCFMVLCELTGRDYSLSTLMQMVFVAEQIMQTGGGWQDQAGGLTGGLKIVTSLPGTEQNIKIEKISLSPFFEKIFKEKLVLMPTGQRHFGRFIVNDVVERYLNGVPESLEGHAKILELNTKLVDSLNSNDYKGFTDCINEHCKILKMISEKVSNESVDGIVAKCFKKADAVSILGAGGGGYLLAVLKDSVSFEDFRDFALEEFPGFKPKARKIDICEEI